MFAGGTTPCSDTARGRHCTLHLNIVLSRKAIVAAFRLVTILRESPYYCFLSVEGSKGSLSLWSLLKWHLNLNMLSPPEIGMHVSTTFSVTDEQKKLENPSWQQIICRKWNPWPRARKHGHCVNNNNSLIVITQVSSSSTTVRKYHNVNSVALKQNIIMKRSHLFLAQIFLVSGTYEQMNHTNSC